MRIELVAMIFETLGTLMIAYAAIMVHHRVLNEHKIDSVVETFMRKEQVVAKVGVALVIASFFMQAALLYELI